MSRSSTKQRNPVIGAPVEEQETGVPAYKRFMAAIIVAAAVFGGIYIFMSSEPARADDGVAPAAPVVEEQVKSNPDGFFSRKFNAGVWVCCWRKAKPLPRSVS